jgi:hypothetical protein
MKKLKLFSLMIIGGLLLNSCSSEEISVQKESKIDNSLKTKLLKIATNSTSDVPNLLNLVNTTCDCVLIINDLDNSQSFAVPASQYNSFVNNLPNNLTINDIYLSGVFSGGQMLFSQANIIDYLTDCILNGSLDTFSNWWSNSYSIAQALSNLGNSQVTFSVGSTPNMTGSNLITVIATGGIAAVQAQLNAYNAANNTSYKGQFFHKFCKLYTRWN